MRRSSSNERCAAYVVMLVVGVVLPAGLRADPASASATVHVSATIGPSSVTVAVEDGWARWSVAHVDPAEVAASVRFELPDGTEVSGARVPDGAWAELWNDDGPTRLVREGPPVERTVPLFAVR